MSQTGKMLLVLALMAFLFTAILPSLMTVYHASSYISLAYWGSDTLNIPFVATIQLEPGEPAFQAVVQKLPSQPQVHGDAVIHFYLEDGTHIHTAEGSIQLLGTKFMLENGYLVGVNEAAENAEQIRWIRVVVEADIPVEKQPFEQYWQDYQMPDGTWIKNVQGRFEAILEVSIENVLDTLKWKGGWCASTYPTIPPMIQENIDQIRAELGVDTGQAVAEMAKREMPELGVEDAIYTVDGEGVKVIRPPRTPGEPGLAVAVDPETGSSAAVGPEGAVPPEWPVRPVEPQPKTFLDTILDTLRRLWERLMELLGLRQPEESGELPPPQF